MALSSELSWVGNISEGGWENEIDWRGRPEELTSHLRLQSTYHFSTDSDVELRAGAQWVDGKISLDELSIAAHNQFGQLRYGRLPSLLSEPVAYQTPTQPTTQRRTAPFNRVPIFFDTLESLSHQTIAYDSPQFGGFRISLASGQSDRYDKPFRQLNGNQAVVESERSFTMDFVNKPRQFAVKSVQISFQPNDLFLARYTLAQYADHVPVFKERSQTMQWDNDHTTTMKHAGDVTGFEPGWIQRYEGGFYQRNIALMASAQFAHLSGLPFDFDSPHSAPFNQSYHDSRQIGLSGAIRLSPQVTIRAGYVTGKSHWVNGLALSTTTSSQTSRRFQTIDAYHPNETVVMDRGTAELEAFVCAELNPDGTCQRYYVPQDAKTLVTQMLSDVTAAVDKIERYFLHIDLASPTLLLDHQAEVLGLLAQKTRTIHCRNDSTLAACQTGVKNILRAAAEIHHIKTDFDQAMDRLERAHNKIQHIWHQVQRAIPHPETETDYLKELYEFVEKAAAYSTQQFAMLHTWEDTMEQVAHYATDEAQSVACHVQEEDRQFDQDVQAVGVANRTVCTRAPVPWGDYVFDGAQVIDPTNRKLCGTFNDDRTCKTYITLKQALDELDSLGGHPQGYLQQADHTVGNIVQTTDNITGYALDQAYTNYLYLRNTDQKKEAALAIWNEAYELVGHFQNVQDWFTSLQSVQQQADLLWQQIQALIPDPTQAIQSERTHYDRAQSVVQTIARYVNSVSGKGSFLNDARHQTIPDVTLIVGQAKDYASRVGCLLNAEDYYAKADRMRLDMVCQNHTLFHYLREAKETYARALQKNPKEMDTDRPNPVWEKEAWLALKNIKDNLTGQIQTVQLASSYCAIKPSSMACQQQAAKVGVALQDANRARQELDRADRRWASVSTTIHRVLEEAISAIPDAERAPLYNEDTLNKIGAFHDQASQFQLHVHGLRDSAYQEFKQAVCLPQSVDVHLSQEDRQQIATIKEELKLTCSEHLNGSVDSTFPDQEIITGVHTPSHSGKPGDSNTGPRHHPKIQKAKRDAMEKWSTCYAKDGKADNKERKAYQADDEADHSEADISNTRHQGSEPTSEAVNRAVLNRQRAEAAIQVARQAREKANADAGIAKAAEAIYQQAYISEHGTNPLPLSNGQDSTPLYTDEDYARPKAHYYADPNQQIPGYGDWIKKPEDTGPPKEPDIHPMKRPPKPYHPPKPNDTEGGSISRSDYDPQHPEAFRQEHAQRVQADRFNTSRRVTNLPDSDPTMKQWMQYLQAHLQQRSTPITGVSPTLNQQVHRDSTPRLVRQQQVAPSTKQQAVQQLKQDIKRLEKQLRWITVSGRPQITRESLKQAAIRLDKDILATKQAIGRSRDTLNLLFFKKKHIHLTHRSDQRRAIQSTQRAYLKAQSMMKKEQATLRFYQQRQALLAKYHRLKNRLAQADEQLDSMTQKGSKQAPRNRAESKVMGEGEVRTTAQKVASPSNTDPIEAKFKQELAALISQVAETESLFEAKHPVLAKRDQDSQSFNAIDMLDKNIAELTEAISLADQQKNKAEVQRLTQARTHYEKQKQQVMARRPTQATTYQNQPRSKQEGKEMGLGWGLKGGNPGKKEIEQSQDEYEEAKEPPPTFSFSEAVGAAEEGLMDEGKIADTQRRMPYLETRKSPNQSLEWKAEKRLQQVDALSQEVTAVLGLAQKSKKDLKDLSKKEDMILQKISDIEKHDQERRARRGTSRLLSLSGSGQSVSLADRVLSQGSEDDPVDESNPSPEMPEIRQSATEEELKDALVDTLDQVLRSIQNMDVEIARLQSTMPSDPIGSAEAQKKIEELEHKKIDMEQAAKDIQLQQRMQKPSDPPSPPDSPTSLSLGKMRSEIQETESLMRSTRGASKEKQVLYFHSEKPVTGQPLEQVTGLLNTLSERKREEGKKVQELSRLAEDGLAEYYLQHQKKLNEPLGSGKPTDRQSPTLSDELDQAPRKPTQSHERDMSLSSTPYFDREKPVTDQPLEQAASLLNALNDEQRERLEAFQLLSKRARAAADSELKNEYLTQEQSFKRSLDVSQVLLNQEKTLTKFNLSSSGSGQSFSFADRALSQRIKDEEPEEPKPSSLSIAVYSTPSSHRMVSYISGTSQLIGQSGEQRAVSSDSSDQTPSAPKDIRQEKPELPSTAKKMSLREELELAGLDTEAKEEGLLITPTPTVKSRFKFPSTTHESLSEEDESAQNRRHVLKAAQATPPPNQVQEIDQLLEDDQRSIQRTQTSRHITHKTFSSLDSFSLSSGLPGTEFSVSPLVTQRSDFSNEDRLESIFEVASFTLPPSGAGDLSVKDQIENQNELVAATELYQELHKKKSQLEDILGALKKDWEQNQRQIEELRNAREILLSEMGKNVSTTRTVLEEAEVDIRDAVENLEERAGGRLRLAQTQLDDINKQQRAIEINLVQTEKDDIEAAIKHSQNVRKFASRLNKDSVDFDSRVANLLVEFEHFKETEMHMAKQDFQAKKDELDRHLEEAILSEYYYPAQVKRIKGMVQDIQSAMNNQQSVIDNKRAILGLTRLPRGTSFGSDISSTLSFLKPSFMGRLTPIQDENTSFNSRSRTSFFKRDSTNRRLNYEEEDDDIPRKSRPRRKISDLGGGFLPTILPVI
ncbi:MAG: hypothetical protein IPK86_02350 [Neisseriales bacterium]|nr:MAG: hypothetical protein IPK86_02350 [Neisseriales bacterium]